MVWILDNQDWLIPLATALLANAFPAVPWPRILHGVMTAFAIKGR